jgi:cytochrome c-type biogenesis protein CcmH/NrfF
MKTFLEVLLWFLAILTVVVVPVLLQDWHARHKHTATSRPSTHQASYQCNIALAPPTPPNTPKKDAHAPNNP